MKSIYIIRRIDDLGRIVLPKELRNIVGFERYDPIEISVTGDQMTLKKHKPSCIFCGGTNELAKVREHFICSACLQTIAARAEELGRGHV